MEQGGAKAPNISGSPRGVGDTRSMAEHCLGWAESMGYVETEFLSLAGNTLGPRTGCATCFGYMTPAEEAQGCRSKGDTKVIAPGMEAQKQGRAVRE
jgi:multimeric flavodoxin WrbA